MNVRNSNGNLKRKNQKRLRAQELPCALCGKPIDYSLTTFIDKDGKKKPHPMSFEIDHKIPISKYWLGGYTSARECAEDFENMQPAHRTCNRQKSNKIETPPIRRVKRIEPTETWL